MNHMQSREGARWGDDPGPPKLYEQLCEAYGESNVAKALAIRTKLKADYPHLAVLQGDAHSFAKMLLEFSSRSIEHAARDLRVHSMPETLNLVEAELGAMLVLHPTSQVLEQGMISYRDEAQGLTARKELHAKQVAAQEEADKAKMLEAAEWKRMKNEFALHSYSFACLTVWALIALYVSFKDFKGFLMSIGVAMMIIGIAWWSLPEEKEQVQKFRKTILVHIGWSIVVFGVALSKTQKTWLSLLAAALTFAVSVKVSTTPTKS